MAKRIVFDSTIHAAVPREISHAVDLAAGREMISPSAYVRRCLQNDLIARGFLSATPIPPMAPKQALNSASPCA